MYGPINHITIPNFHRPGGQVLLCHTRHRFAARVINVTLTVSDGEASAAQTFTVRVNATAPGAVTTLAPADGRRGIEVPVSFEWQTLPEADFYRLPLAREPEFESVELDSASISDASIVVASLEYSTIYFWRVRAENGAGFGPWSDIRFFETVASVGADAFALPDAFRLDQHYPHPFNPSTRLSFALPKPSHVSLEVFDAIGRRVAVLSDSDRPAGTDSTSFDAHELPAGINVAQIRADRFVASIKMIHLK